MAGEDFKKNIFDQFARVGKALANGSRLEILEFLAQGTYTVEALAEVARLSVANTSRHLQILRQAGLVEGERSGQHVIYRLSDPLVVDLMTTLRTLAERRFAEVDRLVRDYLTIRDALEPVPWEELLERVRAGTVTVLDVRPEGEYRAGHLPQAENVPLRQLEARMAGLPRDREVIAYCRGPYCVLAFEAVARLRKKGFNARRLRDGFPEWQRAGLPVIS